MSLSVIIVLHLPTNVLVIVSLEGENTDKNRMAYIFL